MYILYLVHVQNKPYRDRLLHCFNPLFLPLKVYRLHTSGRSPAEQRSAILEPVGFTARVVRNLTPQIVYFPKADISLNLDVVKVHNTCIHSRTAHTHNVRCAHTVHMYGDDTGACIAVNFGQAHVSVHVHVHVHVLVRVNCLHCWLYVFTGPLIV